MWRFVEGNPVNDGVIFWIRAVAYDLAVKILSDHLELAELQSWRVDDNHCVSLSTTDNE